MTRFLLSFLVVGTLALNSCSRQDNQAVPRPEAWPRIETPAEEFADIHVDGVEFPVNTEANVSTQYRDGSTWVDIVYPGFKNTRLYLTLRRENDPKALDKAIDNRRERIALNSGGMVTEITDLVSDGGWDCTLVVTRGSVTTPVQLLATDGRQMLSGALYCSFPPQTQPDSISPIVSTVSRDMLHTLKHLRSK